VTGDFRAAASTGVIIDHHRDSRFRALRHECDRNETTVGADRSEIVTGRGGSGGGALASMIADGRPGPVTGPGRALVRPREAGLRIALPDTTAGMALTATWSGEQGGSATDERCAARDRALPAARAAGPGRGLPGPCAERGARRGHGHPGPAGRGSRVPGRGRRGPGGGRRGRGAGGRRGPGRPGALAGHAVRRRAVAGRHGPRPRAGAPAYRAGAGHRAGGRPAGPARRGPGAREPRPVERAAGRGRAADGRLRAVAGRVARCGARLAGVHVAGARPGS
jgi:hypothetical protein